MNNKQRWERTKNAFTIAFEGTEKGNAKTEAEIQKMKLDISSPTKWIIDFVSQSCEEHQTEESSMDKNTGKSRENNKTFTGFFFHTEKHRASSTRTLPSNKEKEQTAHHAPHEQAILINSKMKIYINIYFRKHK